MFLVIFCQIKSLKDSNIFVEFYDKRYTVEKSDLFKDFPRLSLNLMKGQRIALYLDITQYILLPQVSNCVEDQNYSFMKCTRVDIFIRFSTINI